MTKLVKSNTEAILAGIEKPVDRAAFFMDRAKQLSTVGKQTSLELERLLKEVFRALSFDDNDSKSYMFLAKIFKHALDLISAIFCYRYALKLDPTNFQAKKYLCELLVLHGKEVMIIAERTGCVSKYRAALAYFDEALEVNREDSAIWTLKCICHVFVGDLADAHLAINRVIKPNRQAAAEAHILRAKILWGRGLTEQGNADIRVAASIDPNHPEVLAYAGRSFVKAERLYKDCLKAFTVGDLKLALELAKHALFITSEDVKLHILLSKIHRLLGDLQSAYASILKAKGIFEAAAQCGELEYQLELPTDIVRQVNLILNDMSIQYVLSGDYDRGVLLLNKVIKTEKELSRGGLLPVDYKYYVNRGDCYRALHRLSDAIYDYECALEIAPHDWEIKTRLSLAHYLVAADHFNTSAFFDTERAMDRAILHNPKVSEYFSLRGKARYYNGDFAAAYEDFARCVELDPDNTEVRERLGQFDGEETAAMDVARRQRDGDAQTKTALRVAQEEAALRSSVENMLPRYSSERQVMRVKVSDKDNVTMMLNPHVARKLPVMRLLTCSGDITARIQAHRQEEAPLPRIRNDKVFNRAVLADQDLRKKDAYLKGVYAKRMDTSKGGLWGVVETAKELARVHSTHPATVIVPATTGDKTTPGYSKTKLQEKQLMR